MSDLTHLGLEPLFEKAEKEGLWFFLPYQELWLSPSELRAQQSNGYLRFSAENWKLRNPQLALAHAARRADEARRELEELRGRIHRQTGGKP